MAWIESHTVLRNHRKVLMLSRLLKLNIAQTIGHLHLLWHAAIEQQEDGDLSQWSDDLIAEISGYTGDSKKYVQFLKDCGWLDKMVIHDWWDYAGRYLQSKYSHHPEKWQSIKAKHTQSIRKAYGLQGEPTVPPNLTGPTKETDLCVAEQHDMPPSPAENEKGQKGLAGKKAKEAEFDAFAENVVAFLNAKTGREYSVKSKVVKDHLLARFNEGRTAKDCRLVIVSKCRDWLADEKMAKYLRVITLFSRSKFEEYLQEAKMKIKEEAEGKNNVE